MQSDNSNSVPKAREEKERSCVFQNGGWSSGRGRLVPRTQWRQESPHSSFLGGHGPKACLAKQLLRVIY